MVMSDTLISVKNLSRYYGNLCAVNTINFEVKRGQILGFLGPNGAGKSTTMQIIAGTLAPTAGEISVAGFDMLENPLQAKAALGYLPERPPLYREMLVNEYLQFCARLHQVPRSHIAKAVNHAIESCGLSKVSKRLIGNLSKGFQQRVGIAQAIIHSPAAVILDEPTVGLDPIQILEIRNLIKELGKEHSVILSTHILSEVQAVCNHVQIINNGQLVLNDTIDGLFSKMQSTHLKAGFRHLPDDFEKLADIDGVEKIEKIDDNHLYFQYVAEKNPAEILVEQSVANRWGLYELCYEQQSLEQVFMDLTRSDEPETELLQKSDLESE
jgi:ABC-2 type transport system ATP-binding protein